MAPMEVDRWIVSVGWMKTKNGCHVTEQKIYENSCGLVLTITMKGLK